LMMRKKQLIAEGRYGSYLVDPTLRATLHLDAAEINMLRIAPEPYLRSILPNILAETRQNLPNNDPRLVRLSDIAVRIEEKDEVLTEYESNFAIAALQGARSEAHKNQMRVRSFRNVIVGVTSIIAIFVVALAFVGFINPQLLPLCFSDAFDVACPTAERPNEDSPFVPPPPTTTTIPAPRTTIAPSAAAAENQLLSVSRRAAQPMDTIVVEFVGMLAATVAAAAALRRIRGTADPYSLPVALAMLKLPTGALTAFLGLMMLRAGIIPGFVSLNSSAEILAYAVLFGYSQEIFTGLVDRQAQAVLAGNEGANHAGDGTIHTADQPEKRASR
jgi:hypothetical protein